ncbi:MAG: hypothetical protein JEZ11_22175 [Desulfobacterales bacterium]|nr:hypothetical protein [Desulfobacterales bacterium]
MKPLYLILPLLIIGCSAKAQVAHQDVNAPQDYLLHKLTAHDLVLFGTRHKTPSIHSLLTNLIPHLKGAGVTHICLEIEADQEGNFKISSLIDCPSYREMVKVAVEESGIKVVPVDLPQSMYKASVNRNEYMAQQIALVFKEHEGAKVFAIMGNLHVLKTLNWQDHVPNPCGSVFSYFGELVPGKKTFSVVSCVDDPGRCDFARLSGPVAVDVDDGHSGWKIGFTSLIAIKPTRVSDLTDGVIVF